MIARPARRWVWAAALVLTACTATSSAPPPSGRPAPTARPATGPLTLVTEPDEGMRPIDDLLASARRRLDLSMYELADPVVESILAVDASRGVRVRVLLDHNREGRTNTTASTYLSAHGVDVVWAPAAFAASHEKAAVIDGATALVMSLNLVARDYRDTRDFAVIDRDPTDVAAIEVVFDADFAGRPAPVTPDPALVWSPGLSAPRLVDLIGSARSSLLVENEEISSRPIIDALVGAARRGVQVVLVMTASADWSAAFDRLSAAGVRVATYAPSAALYIHAKAIVADGTRAFVGSENFSTASLAHNRELGVLTAQPDLVSSLGVTLHADDAAAPWP